MNYEKLTVERFAQNLKDGKYAGLTGSRRAIGKTDWNKSDRERAHDMANKHFAKSGAATKDKTAKPAKSAAAKKPKVVKKAASAAAKKTTKVAKAAAPKPAAQTADAAPSPTPSSRPPREPVVAGVPRLVFDDPMTVRQHSSSMVIAALSGRALNPLEQRAYDLANESFAKNTTEELGKADSPPSAPKSVPRAPRAPTKAAAAAATTAVPAPAPAPTEPAITPAQVVASPGTAPRIPVPAALGGGGVVPPPITPPANGAGDDDDLSDLTPEERAQHERLARAARATGNPVPGQPS